MCVVDSVRYMFHILIIFWIRIWHGGIGWGREPGGAGTLGLSVRSAWDIGQKYQPKKAEGEKK